MAQKENKFVNYLKRNAYYLAFIGILTVLTILTIMLVVSNNNKTTQVDKTGDSNVEVDLPQTNTDSEVNNTPIIPDDPVVPDTPVVSLIIFDLPVKDAVVLKEYVGASVVYNQTIGAYTGHKAIDFAGEEGQSVFACYSGVVESIVTSKLEGTTITIDHSNGLKSVYNSVEVAENIETGAIVEKGDVIGYMSTNNKTEYLDGPHLHFEVVENGKKIDPSKYLITEDK